MKQLTRLYRNNPVVAFVFDCIAFLIWASTFIFILTIMAVALSAH